MKVVVVAGGTGGHFFPGLAVAQALQKRGHEVLFFIRQKDTTASFLEKEEVPFRTIVSAGFHRSLNPSNIFSLFQLGLGFFQSLRTFWRDRPHAVVVMGGYLSVPPALAARFLKIPVISHEQNVVPGLAGRVLRPVTSRICLSFNSPKTASWARRRVTGNPVRPGFARLSDPADARRKFGLRPDLLTLLVFGGSQGAHFLNTTMKDLVGAIDQTLPSFQILHLTGEMDLAFLEEGYRKASLPFHVAPFCDDMPSAYSASNFVICRAGAGTISELMVVKRPALLIPYPYATANHQMENARVLERLGAADVMKQNEVTADKLKVYLSALFRDLEKLDRMKKSYGRIRQEPLAAAEEIANIVEEVVIR